MVYELDALVVLKAVPRCIEHRIGEVEADTKHLVAIDP